jgi:alkane 1-monooxygenase
MLLSWIVTIGAALSFAFGGIYMWFGVAFVFIVGVGGELLAGDDLSEPEYSHDWILDWNAYLIGLFLVISLITFTWALSSADLLGIGNYLQATFNVDVLSARSENTWIDYMGATLSMGVILGVQGIVVGHELTHRTDKPFDMFVGEWVFALMFGTNFATEHVYGHHKNVGHADKDPVSIPRGGGFYKFLTVGTFNQWKGGMHIERERLNAQGKSFWNLDNKVLRAYLRGLFVAALILYFGGVFAFVAWVFAALYAKFILEGLNFFSHYGMVREPGQPITIRHTWSSNNVICNMMLINLGRHGSHHTYGGRYQYFKAAPDMPMAPYGYLTMTVLSWFPPLFWKVMTPSLKVWTEKYATDAERELVIQQDRASGIKQLEEYALKAKSVPAAIS